MKCLWIRLLAALPLGGATVLIRRGKAEAVRGNPPPRLLRALEEVGDIDCACIYAWPHARVGYRLALHGVPKHLRQRIRNIWNAETG